MLAPFRRGLLVVPVLVLALVVTLAGAAQASCAEAVPIEQALDDAQTVFVGTVTGLQFGGRVATFDVEEIWKGEIAATAIVNGGPTLAELERAAAEGGDVATSADRSYELGGRYLVVSFGRDGGAYADNACSATRPFTSDLDEYRPASAHAPATPDAPAADGGLSGWAWLGLAALAVGVLGGAAAAVVRLRRQRPTHPAAT